MYISTIIFMNSYIGQYSHKVGKSFLKKVEQG